jgi:hypothetical protein
MHSKDEGVIVGAFDEVPVDLGESRFDVIEAKVESFMKQVVEYPPLRRCHSLMETLQRSAKQRRAVRGARRTKRADKSKPLGPPRGMLVTGLSGTGKTTISNHYVERNPRYDVEDRTVIPVLSLELPSEPRANIIGEQLLRALGDPFPRDGSGAHRLERAKELVEKCETDLIILGEVQHVTDNLDRHARDVAADALKDLMNLGVPTVFCALPSALPYFVRNQQLGRRCTPKIRLRPFGISSKEERDEFLGVLMSLHRLLPTVGESALIDPNCALALHFASFGLFGQLSQLIEGALRLALIKEDTMLRREHLKVAFEQTIFPDCGETRNPFSVKFNGLPLTRAEEPYNGLVG